MSWRKFKSLLKDVSATLYSKLLFELEHVRLTTLKNVSSIDPWQILGGHNLKAVCKVVIFFQSLGVNVSSIKSECGQLWHTSLGDTNALTPLLKFWTSVLKLGSVDAPLLPHLIKFVSILICLPTSTTVERLFCVTGVIKTKLRNCLHRL